MKILSLPKGQDVNKLMIYKDGTQYISLESPGSYFATGETIVPATFTSNKISMVGSNSTSVTVGTVTSIDVTDYVAIHIKCKRNSGLNIGCFLAIGSTKNITNFDARVTCVNATTDLSEYVLDISSLTGNKYVYIAESAYNMDVEITELWLSKT